MVFPNTQIWVAEGEVHEMESTTRAADDTTSESSSRYHAPGGWDISSFLFSRDCLDRELKRHHITSTVK